MTRPHRNQGIGICPHCGKIISGLPELPFRAWIRNQRLLDSRPPPKGAAISVVDGDVVIHQYIVTDKANRRVMGRQNMLGIEVKCHDAELPPAQLDTSRVIYQHIRAARTVKNVRTDRGVVTLTHHGLHILQFSGTTPDDSDMIRWDGKVIDKATLIDICRFKVDALTLQPREDRSHHKADPVLDEEWVTID